MSCISLCKEPKLGTLYRCPSPSLTRMPLSPQASLLSSILPERGPFVKSLLTLYPDFYNVKSLLGFKCKHTLWDIVCRIIYK